MSTQCKYHPSHTALWHCPGCGSDFCNSCVPLSERALTPRCTLCRRTLEGLSIAQSVRPFWQNIPTLLVMPLQLVPVTLTLFAAIIWALLPTGKLGALLFFLSLIPLTEFWSSCMENVASGVSLPKKMGSILFEKSKGQFLKVVAVYVILVLLIHQLMLWWPILGYLIAAFFILGAPASLLILMMEKSMLGMLHPGKILYLIRLFGAAYYLLYGVSILASYVAVLAYQWALTTDHFTVKLTLNFAAIYLTLVIAMMAGYLVYQYHKELNFVIDRRSIFHRISSQRVDPLAQANLFIQEGRFEEAQSFLLDHIRHQPDDYKASEKLILLSALQGNQRHFEQLAAEYFNRQLAQGKTKVISDFYCKLSDKGYNFCPESLALVEALASDMKNTRHCHHAIQLIDNFLQQNAMPPGWEKLYLLQAQLLAEYADRYDDAIERLDTICRRSIDQQQMQLAASFRGLLRTS